MADDEKPEQHAPRLLPENATPSLRDRVAKTLSGYLVQYVKGALAQSLIGWVSEKPGRRVVLEHGGDGVVDVTFMQDGQALENPFLPNVGKTTRIEP